MDELQELFAALDRIRPELPELVGADVDAVNQALESYRTQLDQGRQSPVIVRAMILKYLQRYPALLRRVQQEMAVAKGLIYHESATRSFDPSELTARMMTRWRHPQPLPEMIRHPRRPVQVTRFTDITCPSQVWVETPRVAVTVRLTMAPVAESASTQRLAGLRTDVPVTVTVDAPGFVVLEERAFNLTVYPDRDTDRVTFLLRPLTVGVGAVVLEFRQAGNLAGTAAIPVCISATPVEETPARQPGLPVAFEPDAPAPDRTLVIGYEANMAQHQLTFRLYEGETMRAEFPPKALSVSIEAYVADLYSQLSTHASEATGQPDDAAQIEAERLIKQIGRKLWRQVLPQELQNIYLAEWRTWQDSSFLIVSDEPHLPWELVWPYAREWDGPDEPWCAVMHMARWLRRTDAGNGVPGPTAHLRWHRFSAIVPDGTGLPFAQKEHTLLRAIMQTNLMQDCSPLHFALADVLRLFTTGGYDWVHAATHGNFRGGDPGRRSALSLAGQETFSPDDLLDPDIEDHLWANRPGIVFNTCDSGRQGWGLSGAGGWAGQLVGSGAGLFLAAQWSVTDKQALQFAQQFYKSLGDGDSVAQAVRTARQFARQAGDPTWLAYSLYAHPNAVVGG